MVNQGHTPTLSEMRQKYAWTFAKGCETIPEVMYAVASGAAEFDAGIAALIGRPETEWAIELEGPTGPQYRRVRDEETAVHTAGQYEGAPVSRKVVYGAWER